MVSKYVTILTHSLTVVFLPVRERGFMDKDLDYFKDFLENPSAPTLAEFYRMLNLWGEYLQAHKDEFNYLEDEEWREIRERLIAEFPLREAEKDEVNAEWEYLGEIEADSDNLTDEEVVNLMTRQIDLLKNYQDYFHISDEEIADGEQALANFKDSIESHKIIEEKLRISEEKVNKAAAAWDDKMMEIEQKTGKTFQMPLYVGVKQHKGN